MTGHSETALCRRSRPYVLLRLAEDHSRETPFAEFQFYLDLHSSPIKAIDFKLAHQGPPPRSFVLQRRHGVDPGRFPSRYKRRSAARPFFPLYPALARRAQTKVAAARLFCWALDHLRNARMVATQSPEGTQFNFTPDRGLTPHG